MPAWTAILTIFAVRPSLYETIFGNQENKKPGENFLSGFFSQKISSPRKIQHIKCSKTKPGGKKDDTRKFCIDYEHSKLDVHPI